MEKLYYIANARMPTDKAHGIQIAKMCEAFILTGADLTLVVPRRKTDPRSVREYYGLQVEVPLVRIPALDWYTGGRIGYFLSSVSFMISYTFFIWQKKMKKEKCILYTVDLDNYSSSALPLSGIPFFTEMHGGKPNTFAQRFLFRHVRGVFAINLLIIDEFKKKFPYAHPLYLKEPNGVDLDLFAARDKNEARTKLGLPQDKKIALYTGRFFDWKGLEILPQAAKQTLAVEWYIVGGSREEFLTLTKLASVPDNMHFVEVQPQSEIPYWIAAADALIVLGTKRDQQSYFYTSPMKIFEYLPSERAIVASDTPAIRQIVSDAEVFLYAPDDAESLAAQLLTAVLPTSAVQERIERALEKGKTYTWSARAGRILSGIESTLSK